MHRFGERQRWWLLALGWAILLTLGVTGFVRQADELELGSTFLDHLYFTLQLAVLSYEGPSENINWQLEIVRFTAPLMSAGTLLQSASVVFREQFTRWRARRARAHTVVAGLGPVGTRLVEALVADGRDVVAITGDSGSSAAATVGRLDVPVVAGDPAEVATLLAARADRATRVVAASDDDIVNVAVAAAVRDIGRAGGLAPLRCAVRLSDGELAHLLRSTELHGDGHVRLEFFNVHERAAHALLAAHPLEARHDTVAAATGLHHEPDEQEAHGEHDAHLVVLGVGQFGREVILAAAQTWSDGHRRRLRVTLVDRRAGGRYHALRMRHPALDETVDVAAIDLDIGQPDGAAVAAFDEALVRHAPTAVVVAFDDDALAWSSALFVRDRLPRPVDVVVRTDADGGFGRHLQAATGGDGAVGGIVPFAFLDQACTTELIEGGVREQLAQALHEDFLRRTDRSHPLHRPWSELSDTERESSRSAADGIVGRVAAIGGRLAPLRSWSAAGDVFDDDELDRLAEYEHERWREERTAQGWTWGEVRDEVARRNPLLVPWHELAADARDHNLDSARRLPDLLARAGFEVSRAGRA